MMDSSAAIACAIFAVAISGMAKGGFAGLGGLAMPVMVLANPPLESAAVMLPILILQDAVSVWSFRRDKDISVLKIMIPGMTVGVALGYLFSSSVSEKSVLLAVGVASALFGAHRLVAEHGARALLPSSSSSVVGLLFGTFSGFVSHVAHAGGPPYQMWVLPRRLEREALAGTTAIAFAYMNLIKVPAYSALGQFSTASLVTTAWLTPIAFAATLAGVKLVRWVDPARFYPIMYGLMLLAGCKLIWDGVTL